jgi:hypothetical protein
MDPPEITRRSVQRDLSVKMFLSPPIFRAYREAAVNPASKIRETIQRPVHGMAGVVAHWSGRRRRSGHPSRLRNESGAYGKDRSMAPYEGMDDN